MIIEIKDIPNGQKIKHINIDVTFLEGSDTYAVTAKSSQDETKKSKEIPIEMTNLEF